MHKIVVISMWLLLSFMSWPWWTSLGRHLYGAQWDFGIKILQCSMRLTPLKYVRDCSLNRYWMLMLGFIISLYDILLYRGKNSTRKEYYPERKHTEEDIASQGFSMTLSYLCYMYVISSICQIPFMDTSKTISNALMDSVFLIPLILLYVTRLESHHFPQTFSNTSLYRKESFPLRLPATYRSSFLLSFVPITSFSNLPSNHLVTHIILWHPLSFFLSILVCQFVSDTFSCTIVNSLHIQHNWIVLTI